MVTMQLFTVLYVLTELVLVYVATPNPNYTSLLLHIRL